jgi:hypothetical protein
VSLSTSTADWLGTTAAGATAVCTLVAAVAAATIARRLGRTVRAQDAQVRRITLHLEANVFQQNNVPAQYASNSRPRLASPPEPSWPRVLATTASLWVSRRLSKFGISSRSRGIAAHVHPALPARGLLATAGILLPRADRARYMQEYRSELWDLAQTGEGRLRQLLYALRQLRSTIPMGLALRSPRRSKGAAP